MLKQACIIIVTTTQHLPFYVCLTNWKLYFLYVDIGMKWASRQYHTETIWYKYFQKLDILLGMKFLCVCLCKNLPW